MNHVSRIERISDEHASMTRRTLADLDDIDQAARANMRRSSERLYADRMAKQRGQQESRADRAAHEQREEHERLLRAAAERRAAAKATKRDTMPTVAPIDWTDQDEYGNLPTSWLV